MIKVADLREGMYFEAPVLLDRNYVLLTPETPVTSALIKNLKAWDFQNLHTPGAIMGRESPQAQSTSSATLDQNIKEKEGLKKAEKFYKALYQFTAKCLERFAKDNDLNLNAITEEVKKTIAIVREGEKYILRFQDITHSAGKDYITNHSAKTTILSLAIGEKMKMPNHKLIELGIATLLHEVGMLKIPPAVYEKKGSLSEAEKKVVSAHTVLGFRALKEFSLPRDILLGVLEHHERNDGSGYPQNLPAQRISQFGKIIAVACSYDAQISNRPFRSGKDAHTSLTSMLREMKVFYDEEVMKALLGLLSIYPLGSYVTLNNGYTGIVTETNGQDFRSPGVKVLLDRNKRPLMDQPVIHTGGEDLKITRVLNNNEIKSVKRILQEHKILQSNKQNS